MFVPKLEFTAFSIGSARLFGIKGATGAPMSQEAPIKGAAAALMGSTASSSTPRLAARGASPALAAAGATDVGYASHPSLISQFRLGQSGSALVKQHKEGFVATTLAAMIGTPSLATASMTPEEVRQTVGSDRFRVMVGGVLKIDVVNPLEAIDCLAMGKQPPAGRLASAGGAGWLGLFVWAGEYI